MDAIQTFLWTLLLGMGSGIATAVLGYLKSCTTETFSNEKFIATVVWGACIGILMGYFGLDYTQAYQFLMSMGFVAVIDQAAKAIYRNINHAKRKMKAKKKKPVEEEEGSDDDNVADDEE